MAAEDIKVVEREYTPDQAGQRVGWVSVESAPCAIGGIRGQLQDEVYARVSVATIGEDGSHLSRSYAHKGYDDVVDYTPFPGDKPPHIVANVSGFVNVTGMNATIRQGRTVMDFPPFMDGDIGAFVREPLTKKTWFDSESGCVQLLKSGLLEKGADSETYVLLYYYLNAYLAHEGIDRPGQGQMFTDRASAARRPQAPIADPEMQETTEQQLELATSIATELQSALTTDRIMLRSLDALSDVNPDSIPGIFEASRQDVSCREGIVIDRAGQLLVQSLVYKPIGFRPEGRSWAYMDATPSDEHPSGDYARELDFLKDGKSRPVIDQLEHEVAELEKRAEYAQQGKEMLGKLLEAERTQAS